VEGKDEGNVGRQDGGRYLGGFGGRGKVNGAVLSRNRGKNMFKSCGPGIALGQRGNIHFKEFAAEKKLAWGTWEGNRALKKKKRTP
jgi:hypothetical protein